MINKFCTLVFLVLAFLVVSGFDENNKNEFIVTNEDREEFIEYAQSNNQIFFKFRDASIRDESTLRLNKLIYELSKVTDIKVVLNVYADRAEGSDEYTWKLSKDRIKAAQQALIDSGIIKKNNITIETAIMNKYSLGAQVDDEREPGYSRRIDIFIVSE